MTGKKFYCSFCGKAQSEVETLIASMSGGGGQIFICDECVDGCAIVCADMRRKRACDDAVKAGGPNGAHH